MHSTFLEQIFLPLQGVFTASPHGRPIYNTVAATSNSSRANRKRIEGITQDRLQMPRMVASNFEAYDENAALFWDQPAESLPAY
ncbi:uncharacterized protein HRG_09428 [Hirsutella rhossiliensis]|uniref:Uncharacterized protein n=1 Tax=Hirsutella rhossiliensis TaxID=111463 RepID=A0A9P8SG37_9HYPO|nr:uncharacterized protein HRG_09428 [Hirsutella rhossiliensis]KAH0959646.1 hypothetical protein HRG_09428 [Hirsutella rhossiliensis]